MGGTCGTYGFRRGVYRVLLWRPKGKRPLGNPGCRWEVNIEIDLQVVESGSIDWTVLAQDGDS
jgi:hypothetical protein